MIYFQIFTTFRYKSSKNSEKLRYFWRTECYYCPTGLRYLRKGVYGILKEIPSLRVLREPIFLPNV